MNKSQESVEEQPYLDGRPGADRDVGRDERPSGDKPGPWSDRFSHERVDRTGVTNMSREFDETISNEADADDRKHEGHDSALTKKLCSAHAEKCHRADWSNKSDRERGCVREL